MSPELIVTQENEKETKPYFAVSLNVEGELDIEEFDEEFRKVFAISRLEELHRYNYIVVDDLLFIFPNNEKRHSPGERHGFWEEIGEMKVVDEFDGNKLQSAGYFYYEIRDEGVLRAFASDYMLGYTLSISDSEGYIMSTMQEVLGENFSY